MREQGQLYPFLCIALGGNGFLHPYLDELYRKNEWEYFEAYQKSDLRETPLFTMYTAKSEEKIRQVAGILEWCRQKGQFGILDQLIKKGYKFVYHYVKQKQSVDIEHFMRSYAKRQKNKAIKEIELIYQNIVLWYLCEREDKLLHKNNIGWESFQDLLSSTWNDINVQEELFSKQRLNQYEEEIGLLYKKYNIPKNFRFDSLGFFIDFLISNSYINNKDMHSSIETKVQQESPSRIIFAIGGWLKNLKIHELDATEQIPFIKEDLDEVFLEMIYAKKYKSITNEEQDLFFVSCLYLKCLSFHFHQTKRVYLDDSKQQKYIEMQTREALLKQEEDKLLKMQQEWELTIRKQQNEIEGLKQDLRDAHLKMRFLEEKIEGMDDDSKEVHALRNLVYSEEQDEFHTDELPSLTIIKECIRSKRVIVFGGSPNWRQKLKNLLPTMEFVDADEINRDLSKIQRADAVFINTSVFGHSFYKKIMKEISLCNTPLFYLNGKSNVEKTTLEIYKSLTQG